MSVADEKQYFRAILKEARESIPEALAASMAALIQDRVLRAEFYRRAKAVVLYSPIGNEVDTSAIFADASYGPVFYPRLEANSRELAICAIQRADELVRGKHGILQPVPAAEPIDPASLAGAMVLVPGVAFTARGERLGRGGGHYDRLLARLPRSAVTVGLAYSFQLMDQLPHNERDRRVDHVITEAAIHRALDVDAREDIADPTGSRLVESSPAAADRNQGGISK